MLLNLFEGCCDNVASNNCHTVALFWLLALCIGRDITNLKD